WSVDREGHLVSRPEGPDILSGVTRKVLLEATRSEGMKVVELPFTPEEAKSALEAFISASSAILLPVTQVDGQPVGNGAPRSLSLRLREAYLRHCELSC